MLIRTNPHQIYRPSFRLERGGLTIITRHLIVAWGRVPESVWSF